MNVLRLFGILSASMGYTLRKTQGRPGQVFKRTSDNLGNGPMLWTSQADRTTCNRETSKSKGAHNGKKEINKPTSWGVLPNTQSLPEGRHSPYFVLFWNRIRAFYCTRGARRLAGITEVEAKFIKSGAGSTFEHVRQVSAAIKDEPTKEQVFEKIVREDLSKRQSRKVADAVAQAETPEERQAILDTPFDNPMFDRIVRAIMKLFDNQMR